MRELLGSRRHLSFQFVDKPYTFENTAFSKETKFAEPKVQVIMFRSSPVNFLQSETASLYDLPQVILNDNPRLRLL